MMVFFLPRFWLVGKKYGYVSPMELLSDRYQNRGFILGGLLLAVVFIPLSGLAASFWSLLFFVAVGSIGSAMFHPSVTGMVPLYAGRNAGLSMSIFNTGGTLAFAVSPFQKLLGDDAPQGLGQHGPNLTLL